MSKTPRTDAAADLPSGVCCVDIRVARQLELELETALKQNAQMREICELARCLATGQDCVVDNLEIVCKAMDILDSDAGKDYVHKSEVEKAYFEGHDDGRNNIRDGWWKSRARKIVEGESI